MAAVNPTLFSWDAVEAQSDLERLRLALDYLPDRDIIEALQAQRGRGRNDFPIAAMWNALLAGIVFQHASVESLLRELQRNPALAQACGFDTLPIQKRPALTVSAMSTAVSCGYAGLHRRRRVTPCPTAGICPAFLPG